MAFINLFEDDDPRRWEDQGAASQPPKPETTSETFDAEVAREKQEMKREIDVLIGWLEAQKIGCSTRRELIRRLRDERIEVIRLGIPHTVR